jgi:hypothetical protein
MRPVHIYIKHISIKFLVTKLDHDAVGSYCVRVDRTRPHSLTRYMRGRQFSSLLAHGFCVGVARNEVTHSAVVFPLPFPSLPSRRFVPSHSNQTLFNFWMAES